MFMLNSQTIFKPLQHNKSILKIKKLSTTLSVRDRIDGILVRCDIRRNSYKVECGLYSCGSPNQMSPVLVTANYKLTFDMVRKELGGMNLYLLVLDTHGVNVWCAAGKGTFGTGELLKKIKEVHLSEIVSHREIIVPQLGAPGIAAYSVQEKSGFTVQYGPVYARDLREYFGNGKNKTDKMRRVEFTLHDRLAVAPVEIFHAWPLVLITLAVSILFSLPFNSESLHRMIFPLLSLTGGIFAGTVLFPALLPFLPFRSFVAKGAVLGFVWSITLAYLTEINSFSRFVHEALPIVLMTIPLVSFLSMNFTGASTFTCQKGAELEVKRGLPLILISVLAGIILTVFHFISRG